MTDLFQLDPLEDDRWVRLTVRRPEASMFHTREWLRCLHRTYGYQPVAYTTCPPGRELNSGHVFCRIKSWLTGQRLVSLPFSDHTNFLADDQNQLGIVLESLRSGKEAKHYKYIEIRPTHGLVDPAGFQQSDAFYWHRLALEDSLSALFGRFHKSCIQRKIRRAHREKLEYSSGRTESFLSEFYRLLVLTHRRHQLPPQPIVWFRNLLQEFGEKLTIRIASKNGVAIGGIMTLAFKQSVVYKYGGSDERYHSLGAMPFLLWNTIQEAIEQGFTELDLGRSDCENRGLATFKEHWGAMRNQLQYWRYSRRGAGLSRQWELKTAKRLFRLAPAKALPVAGRLLYKHVG